MLVKEEKLKEWESWEKIVEKIDKYPKHVLTTKEVAEILGVSQRTIVNYILQGKIIAYQYGRKYLIEKVELYKFIGKSNTYSKEI